MISKVDKSVALQQLSLLLGSSNNGRANTVEELKDFLKDAMETSLVSEDYSEVERLLFEEVIVPHQGDMVVRSEDGNNGDGCDRWIRMEEILIQLATEFGGDLPLLYEICGPVEYWLGELRTLYHAAMQIDDIISGQHENDSQRKKNERKLWKQQKRWSRLFGEYSKNFPLYASSVITQFLSEIYYGQGSTSKTDCVEVSSVFDFFSKVKVTDDCSVADTKDLSDDNSVGRVKLKEEEDDDKEQGVRNQTKRPKWDDRDNQIEADVATELLDLSKTFNEEHAMAKNERQSSELGDVVVDGEVQGSRKENNLQKNGSTTSKPIVPISEDHNAITFATSNPIPEVLFYADVLGNHKSLAETGHVLRRCLFRLDTLEKAKISNRMEDRQRVNNEDLPEIKELNRAFYLRWITRNRNEHPWILEPEPDFADGSQRAARLHCIMNNLWIDEKFCTEDYNYVFLRKDSKEIKSIIRRWINSCENKNGNCNQMTAARLSAKELVSIIFNLLRRQEDWEQDFIKLLNSFSLRERKVADVAEMLTTKGLFYVAFQHSSPELRVKLMQDFAAAGHAVPLVFPSCDGCSRHNVLNSYVYYCLPPSISVGVFSLGVGKEACYQLGKTELVNHILGTQFECGASSFFNYGTVDLDCGVAFNPDRRICVADAHGRLDEQFYPMLSCFSNIIAHVTAKDLIYNMNVVREDLERLKVVLEESNECKLFLLIRDAGLCNLSAEFVDGREELAAAFPLLEEIFGEDGQQHRCFFPMAVPDLRAGTLNEKIQQDVRDWRVRKPILTSIYSDIKTCDASSKRGAWYTEDEGQNTSNSECKSKSFRFVSKQSFVEIILKHSSLESTYEEKFKLDKFIAAFINKLESFKNNFFDKRVLPVRCLLRELRKCEKQLKRFVASNHSELDMFLNQKKKIVEELELSQPCQLLQEFLMIMDNDSDAITIVNELAVQLKLFSERNVTKELAKRAAMRKKILDLGHDDDKDHSSEERVKLDLELREVCEQIDQKVFSVEILWREAMALCNYSKQWEFDVDGQKQKLLKRLAIFAFAGEPFELVDGDNLKFSSNTFSKVFTDCRFHRKRVFVISVLGPQSSGKSTLLNFLFGSKFSTGTGRCTKGVYGNCINIDHPDYDMILILDTEGLQSTEKNDDEFDRKITLFCLAVSHLVIINVKGDMHNSMKRLLEICILSLSQLQKAKMGTPQVLWCFNQNPVLDKLPFLRQIEDITTEVIGANPDARDVVRFMEVQDENLFVLSFAFNITTRRKNPTDSGQMEDWQRCEPRSEFAVEVAHVSKRIETLMSSQGERRQSQRLYEFLHSWVDMAAENWRTIENYPDLVSFADVKEMKDNRILLKASEDWESEFLKKSDHDNVVHTLLEENVDMKKSRIHGYLKGQEVAIRTKIREYFDGIYRRIKRKLTKLAREFEFRRKLIEIYQRKLKVRVDSYYHEALNLLTCEIQRTVSEMGRLNGREELELKMIQLMHAEKAFSTEEATEEFNSTYKRILMQMTEELDLKGMEDQLFTSMMETYKGLIPLPSTVVGNFNLQNRIRRNIQENEIQHFAGEFAKFFLGTSASILRPVPLQQHYKTVSVSNLKAMSNSSKYLNVLDYFSVENAGIAFCRQSLPSHIQWPSIADYLYQLCKFNCRYQSLNEFFQIFSVFGFTFEQNFQERVEDIICNSGNNWYQQGKKQSLNIFLKKYSCFSGEYRKNPIKFVKKKKGPFELIQPQNSDMYDYVRHDKIVDFTMHNVSTLIKWKNLRDDILQVLENGGGEARSSLWEKVCVVEQYLNDLGYTWDPSFADELKHVLNGRFLLSNRKDAGENLFREYDYFNKHPLVDTGFVPTFMDINQVYRLRACRFLKHGGRDLFIEFHEPINLKSLDSVFQGPNSSTQLNGGRLRFSVLPDKDTCFGCGLRYLIDPCQFNFNQDQALRELRALVLQDIRGGWPQIFLDLWKVIESQINLESFDCSAQGYSISSFSVDLLKIIHTKVREFVARSIDVEFGRFGMAIDMDGISALHFYALICSWKLLSSGQKCRAMKEIRNMKEDEENWRIYFISNVCSQPISASKAVGKTFIRQIVDGFMQKSQIETGRKIYEELAKFRELFSSRTIQAELDEKLLFSECTETQLVVEYVTRQTEFVMAEFEKRFKSRFSQIKEQAFLRVQDEFQRKIKQLQNCFVVLKKFLEDHKMQDMTSNVMFVEAESKVFNLEAEIANRKALDFFICFCEGGKMLSSPRFDCGLHVVEPATILSYRDVTRDIQIPLLYYFCDESLNEIGQCISENANINWSLVDMGLDHLYNTFKNASIGCPETCPTCGRKCDQDVNALNHTHMCELGHQIRGMSGIRLENGMSSTETCDEIDNDRRIFLENENVWCTWYEKKQRHSDWTYTSLDENDARIRRIVNFRHCWNTYGSALCQHHQNNGIPIDFAPYGKNTNVGNCHYIVVLDESGSMQGKKFQDALAGAVTFGEALFRKTSNAKISAVLFGNSARVLFREGDRNSLRVLESCNCSRSGTRFGPALEMAMGIIEMCTEGLYSRHIILLYTDGISSYPADAVNRIKQFRSSHSEVELHAICEEKNPETLERICQTLYTSDYEHHLHSNVTPDQLGQVMSEIIAV